MNFLSNLQKETLLKVDELVEKDLSFDEIWWELQKDNYDFITYSKNGYCSKTHFHLYKNNENSYVELVKRRNGKASWETIKIS